MREKASRELSKICGLSLQITERSSGFILNAVVSHKKALIGG